MESPLDVLPGVKQSDGTAVGATGGVFGLGKLEQKPLHSGWIKGGIDLDGGVAGDGGGDAGAEGDKGFCGRPFVGVGGGLIDDLAEGPLELCAFQSHRGSFDCKCLRTKGFHLEAIALKLLGDLREDDHLGRFELDQKRHQQALALDALDLAVVEDFLEQNALVGDVLIDDPEAIFARSEDEGFSELAEGSERAQMIEI